MAKVRWVLSFCRFFGGKPLAESRVKKVVAGYLVMTPGRLLNALPAMTKQLQK